MSVWEELLASGQAAPAEYSDIGVWQALHPPIQGFGSLAVSREVI